MPASRMDNDDIAERLRWLRLAISKVQGLRNMTEWAQFVGVSLSGWHNYERGYRRIQLDEAVKICGKTGASLDWIYRGDAYWHTLPEHVQNKLSAVHPSRNGHSAKSA